MVAFAECHPGNNIDKAEGFIRPQGHRLPITRLDLDVNSYYFACLSSQRRCFLLSVVIKGSSRMKDSGCQLNSRSSFTAEDDKRLKITNSAYSS